jgi:hypothetical protein
MKKQTAMQVPTSFFTLFPHLPYRRNNQDSPMNQDTSQDTPMSIVDSTRVEEVDFITLSSS